MEFQKGDKVEVCSKKEGFLGSYYTATVFKKLDFSSYAVQYKNLVEDEDMSKPLIETFSAYEVRPVPPRIKFGSGFFLFYKVDAFDKDGWWAVGRQGYWTERAFVYLYFRLLGMRLLTMFQDGGFTWIGLMASGFLQRRWFLDYLLAFFLDKE